MVFRSVLSEICTRGVQKSADYRDQRRGRGAGRGSEVVGEPKWLRASVVDEVLEAAVALEPVRLAGMTQVLEMGEGLAVRHLSLGPR